MARSGAQTSSDGVGQRVDEARVRVHRCGALHDDAGSAAGVGRLDVEVVEHLHVIAEEADGAEDHRVETVRGARARR